MSDIRVTIKASTDLGVPDGFTDILMELGFYDIEVTEENR